MQDVRIIEAQTYLGHFPGHISMTGLLTRLIEMMRVLEHGIFKVSETMLEIQIEQGNVYLALYGKNIVGVMVLVESLPWHHAMEIDKLVVVETHRRRGIGKDFLRQAAQSARGSYDRLLVAARHDYHSAEFYKKCGFSVVYEDDIVCGMEKKLI